MIVRHHVLRGEPSFLEEVDSAGVDTTMMTLPEWRTLLSIRRFGDVGFRFVFMVKR